MKKNKNLFEVDGPTRLLSKSREEEFQKRLKDMEDENIKFTQDIINLNRNQKRIREPKINEIKKIYNNFKSAVEVLKNMILNFINKSTTIDFDDNSIISLFEKRLVEINKNFINLNNTISDSDFESFSGSSKLGNIRVTRFGEMKSEYIAKDFYLNINGFKKQFEVFSNILNRIRSSDDKELAIEKIIEKINQNFIPLLDEIIQFFDTWFSIERRIYDNKIYENIVLPEKSHQEKIDQHINSLSTSINLFNKNISRGLTQDPRIIITTLINNLKDLIESATEAKRLLQYKSTIMISILMIKTFLKKKIKSNLIQNLNRATSEKTLLPAVKEIFYYLSNSTKTK